MSELEETFHGHLRYAELLDGLVREYPFAKHLRRPDTGRPYMFRFDFAWPELKIGIELQGGIFRYDPSHTSIKRIKEDYEKRNLAATLGWRVFYFHSGDVDDGTALNQVEVAVREARAA